MVGTSQPAQVKHLYELAPRYGGERIPRVTQVRSTPLTTSLQQLKQLGLYASYAQGFSQPETLEALLGLAPATWMDIELAQAHYAVLDGLRLPESTQLQLSAQVGSTVAAYLAGTLRRMNTGMGVTPWAALAHGQRLWDRMCKGGDLCVSRAGPKDAVISMHEMPLMRFDYFRLSLRATLKLGISMWCRVCYVSEHDLAYDDVAFKVSWV